MKIVLNLIVCLAISVAIFSCNIKQNNRIGIQSKSMLDSLGIDGSVLFFNLTDRIYYSNNFDWAEKGRLPASTFKIPNSIIAIETKVVEDENDTLKWRGEARDMKIWERDMPLKEAFHLSCVPCYQEIARSVGVERMNHYASHFNYGNMDIGQSNIDKFWLEGKSRINQFQQIQFLKNFYQEKFDLKPSTYASIKRMMVMSDTDKYVLRGKTGWSVRNGNNNGWLVGYIETKPKRDIWFFATNINPKENTSDADFLKARHIVTLNIFNLIHQN